LPAVIGVGKSTLVAWLLLWAMATLPDTRGVITANTESQLRTKTWSELGKWHNMFLFKDFFTLEATTLFEKDHKHTWRIDAIAWSENNSEAFAGMHNAGKRIIIVFDEASAVADKIWEVSEGALTDADTQIVWLVFGNPTRNSGRFRECFRRLKHRWRTKHVDSRDVPDTNKEQLQQLVDDYGIDSDVVRVRILGQFPESSENQFISTALVTEAQSRHLTIDQYSFAPPIIGVDAAWGGDSTVIYLRQGLMSKLLKEYKSSKDDFFIANEIIKFQKTYKCNHVFIDFGYGTGIYSAGKVLGYLWTLVPFGGQSNRIDCLNKRAQIWKQMKEWMQEGGALDPLDKSIGEELASPEYSFDIQSRLKIEGKKEMKARGISSPDFADALALTFSFPVNPIGSAFNTNFNNRIDDDDIPVMGAM